jgi:hypothetical protein
MKKDIHWAIENVNFVVRNVPYIILDDEEFFDTDVAIRLEMIKDLMVNNETPHDFNFDLVADIEF